MLILGGFRDESRDWNINEETMKDHYIPLLDETDLLNTVNNPTERDAHADAYYQCCEYLVGYISQLINRIKITYGIFNDLYTSKGIDTTFISDEFKPWDKNTVLHCKFNGNLIAGSTELSTYGVDKLKLMRKKHDDNIWNLVYEKKLGDSLNNRGKYDIEQDFNIYFEDKYACSGTLYDYAVTAVNSLYDIDEEVTYATTKNPVFSDFDGIGIADKDKIFYTRLNCQSLADITFTIC